jgi:hypothetical protein
MFESEAKILKVSVGGTAVPKLKSLVKHGTGIVFG